MRCAGLFVLAVCSWLLLAAVSDCERLRAVARGSGRGENASLYFPRFFVIVLDLRKNLQRRHPGTARGSLAIARDGGGNARERGCRGDLVSQPHIVYLTRRALRRLCLVNLLGSLFGEACLGKRGMGEAR